MTDRVGCALVELVVVSELFDVFLAICRVMLILAKVTISDCLETIVHLDRFQRVAARTLAIHRVQSLHLRQVILASLVVILHPSWLLFVRLDVVDQVPLTATTRIIIIRNQLVSLIPAEFD